LVLDLCPDTGCDVIGQLVVVALDILNHLLELANHWVSYLLLSLFPALKMSF
jgi:hypothetical protein